MDSNNFAAKNGPDESDIARTDDEISYLVNADVYKKWRSQYVDVSPPIIFSTPLYYFALKITKIFNIKWNIDYRIPV